MKAYKVIILFASLFFSVNIMANNNLKVLSNTCETETGYSKVLTTYDEATSKPIKKTEYHYSTTGNLLSKTLYLWNGNSGWKQNQKFEYQFDDQNRPIATILSKWDEKTQSWSAQKTEMDYSKILQTN
jgi:hypothetical protein